MISYSKSLNYNYNGLTYLTEHISSTEKGLDSLSLYTKITLLRKLFYNGWMWDKVIIPTQADIKLEDHFQLTEGNILFEHSLRGHRPNLVWNQEENIIIKITADHFVDVSHCLAGLDALIHKSIVPDFATTAFYKFIIPTADNDDVATWLGDLASYAVHIMLLKAAGEEVNYQQLKEEHSPLSDISGNVYAYGLYEELKSRISQKHDASIAALFQSCFERSDFSNFSITAFLRLKNIETISQEQFVQLFKKPFRNVCFYYIYSTDVSKLKKFYLIMLTYFKLKDNELELEIILADFYTSHLKQIVS